MSSLSETFFFQAAGMVLESENEVFVEKLAYLLRFENEDVIENAEPGSALEQMVNAAIATYPVGIFSDVKPYEKACENIYDYLQDMS